MLGTFEGGGRIIRIFMKIILNHKFEYLVSLENLLFSWHEFLIGKKNRQDVQNLF
jgi:hypothetical protein